MALLIGLPFLYENAPESLSKVLGGGVIVVLILVLAVLISVERYKKRRKE